MPGARVLPVSGAKLAEVLKKRMEELRALTKLPIFLVYTQRVRASAIAMTAHAAFMAFFLEPLVAWLFPPPDKPNGLLAIFSGPAGPAPHEEILTWLDPLLWVLGWAAFCIFLDRSIKPALARARERSRDLEAEAARKLDRGEVLAGLTLLEQAASVSPDPGDEARLQATMFAVRESQRTRKGTALATAAGDGVGQETTQLPVPVETAVAEAPRRTMANGRISVDARLGAGAMGQVYAATDQRLDRRMAIKELADGFAADETYRERFLREARVLARLSHPHIVQVYDLLDEAGRFYLCMELVEGDSLESELLLRGQLPLAEAASIGRQIASALAYAHHRGVIHRDLKPANVLLTADRTVKVVDFGVARLVDQRMTRTGAIIGTPVYMAPEQIDGGEVDGRADLYALGVLLYELAAGEPPFDGNFASLLVRHLKEPPPPLQLEPGDPLAAPFADLVEKLLAKEPADRPASAGEVAEQLAALVAAAAA